MLPPIQLSHNFVFVSGLVSPAVLPAPETAEPATGTRMTAVGWGKDGVSFPMINAVT